MRTGDERPAPRPPSGVAARIFQLATIAALVYASWAAWRRAWVCDDAFISFRYAESLVRGLGLVFNPGERVEGYSNFLWTLWTALGFRMGVEPEHWTTAAGILCYLVALSALAWNAWGQRAESPGRLPWIPLAAGLGALHPDWNVFATGGLETSLFTLEITLVYVVLARGPVRPGRAAAAGLLLALAAMTRPDGLILAPTVILSLLLTEPRRLRTVSALSLAFLLVWVPYTAWRVGYYGDFFPNTYYAKSASVAWYSQGAVYVTLYFVRYWPLLLGLGLVVAAWSRTRDDHGPAGGETAPDPWRRRVTLAALPALAYVGLVLRVGGDFMFARFLIPVTPLLLVLLELGAVRVAPRARGQWLLAGIVAAGLVLTPYPLPRDPFGSVRGIVFEPHFYSHRSNEMMRRRGLTLRPFFEGLPVRMAFFGGEARLVYYARPRVAIECVTGLTDREIARQPLRRRGRVGHEKLASVGYLLDKRRTHVTFFRDAAGVLKLDRVVPNVTVDLGGIQGRVLTWDPALLDSLRSRGGTVQDFPGELDWLLGVSAETYRWVGWLTYDNVHRFYFAQAPDPRREALLRERFRELARTPAPPGPGREGGR